MELLSKIIEIVPPLLFAMVLHEVAHGFVAYRLGDPTAKISGRISLNPLVHIDWIWTVIMPATLIYIGSPIVFGAAKPVPVDPRYFKNPRKGMAIVAIAGPVINFILAIFCYFLLSILSQVKFSADNFILSLIVNWLAYGILINLIFGLFNLIPVPPLDGGRILVGILPVELARKVARLEPYGFVIVIILIYLKIPQMVLGPVLNIVMERVQALF